MSVVISPVSIVERDFFGIGGAKMRPMLSREVEEGEQDIAVFGQMNWLAIRDTEQK